MNEVLLLSVMGVFALKLKNIEKNEKAIVQKMVISSKPFFSHTAFKTYGKKSTK